MANLDLTQFALPDDIKNFLDTSESGTSQYSPLDTCFKTNSYNNNDKLYTTSYIGDKGYDTTFVMGKSPVINVSGDFLKNDPVCAYIWSIYHQVGAARMSKFKQEFNGETVTCPCTVANINFNYDSASNPVGVSFDIYLNGEPTVTNS